MSKNDVVIDAALQAQINQARQAGEVLDETEPRAVKAWYEMTSARVFIEIKNGIVMGVPYQLLEGLELATPEQLAKVEVTPSGYGLHWEGLDVDLGVPQLVAGIFGTKTWMKELGRLGDWQNLPRKQRLLKKMVGVVADLGKQRLQCCVERVAGHTIPLLRAGICGASGYLLRRRSPSLP
jgi:Protein of unknown function (DUF2442)